MIRIGEIMASNSAIVDLCVKVESGNGTPQEVESLLSYAKEKTTDVNIRLRACTALLSLLLALAGVTENE